MPIAAVITAAISRPLGVDALEFRIGAEAAGDFRTENRAAKRCEARFGSDGTGDEIVHGAAERRGKVS